MPNAHEYRDAAHQLRRLAAQLHRDDHLVRWATDPDGFTGESLAGVLRNAADAQHRAVDVAVGELTRLAAICDQRAEICEQFATELRRHRLLVDDRGPRPPALRPPAPIPPAWWVRT